MSMIEKFNEWRGKDRRRREVIYVAVTHELSESTQSLIEQLIEAQGDSGVNNKLDQLFVQLTRMETEQGLMLDLVEKLGTDPAAINEAAARIRTMREQLKSSIDSQTPKGEL